MSHPGQLRTIIGDYLAAFPEEADRLAQLRDLLTHCTDDSSLIDRNNFIGHVTVSGIVLARDTGKVLKIYHPSLRRYLQPGGHIEDTDDSPLAAAEREVHEETTLTALQYIPFHFNPSIPIDIDTHPIPANPPRKEKNHFHHDLRYLFVAPIEADIKSDDSHGPPKYKWDDVTVLKAEQTYVALADKIDRLHDRERRQLRFYEAVVRSFTARNHVSAIVVTHLLPDILEYLNALQSVATVCAILPKQKSKDAAIAQAVRSKYRDVLIDPIDRSSLTEPDAIVKLLSRCEGRVVLFDIGGWFAAAAASNDPRFYEKVIGIVEDTENGHQKYEEVLDKLKVPVFSAARSPLKNNEDYLVGQSVLFSADVLLREQGKLIQYMPCGIFGYGKIGRSLARHLLARGIKPQVYDINPVVRVAAYNDQCEIPQRDELVSSCDVLFCATGSKALSIQDFRTLRKGAFVFSVTSSDDEFDLSFLESEYRSQELAPHLYLYSSVNNHFFLVNKGNAVNFIHKAVLGDFIHLVRAEMLKGYECLITTEHKPGIYVVDRGTRENIARAWLKHVLMLDHDSCLPEQPAPPFAEPALDRHRWD